MKKIHLIAFLIILSMLLCACGSSDEPDGIDSVTYISEIGQQDTVPSPETTEDPLSGLGGKPLAVYNGTEYSSSLYLLFMKEAFDSILDKYDIAPGDVPGTEVLLSNGTVCTGKEYCESYAKEEFEWVCLLYSQYSGYGKALTESRSYPSAAAKASEELKQEPQLFSDLAVTLSDLILYNIYTDLFYDVFVFQYTSDGDDPSSDEALSSLMDKNVRKVSLILLPLYDTASYERYSEAERTAVIKLSKEYLKRYKSGESFSDLYSENRQLQDPDFLNSFNNKPYIFYSISDPMLPAAITNEAEKLKDHEASIVTADNYVCVVLRLPVNETRDEEWLSYALELAFDSPIGDEYAEKMSGLYDSLSIVYDEDVLSQLTLENFISETAK